MRAATLFATILAVVCATAAAETSEQIFKRVSPSIVVVESLDAKGVVTTLGSGVVVRRRVSADIFDRVAAQEKGTKVVPSHPEAFVITNRHVVEDGVTFKVERNGKTWPAKLIRVGADHDLAELSVDGLDAPAVQVRDSSTLAVGEKVFAIGAPEGFELTISEGLISGLRDFAKGRVIQTSAAISPGSSGGGLFDSQGRLVGITAFYLKEGQSLNFALPAEWTVALDREPIKAAPVASEDSPPSRALVWFKLGEAYASLQQYDKAVSAEREAVRLDPKDATAWFDLGLYYAELRQYDKEVSVFQEFIRLKPGDKGAWVSLGLAYDKFGQYGKALNAFQAVIRLEPGDERSWVSLGLEYNLFRQYDKAVNALQQAIQLKPGDEYVWVELGNAYGHLGQYDKAVSAEQEATRLAPGDESAWVNLGHAYDNLGQHNRAVSALQEAIRLKPGDEGAWVILGVANVLLGQYDKAVSADQEAIRLKPDDAVAWSELGLAYHGLGQQAEVIKVYEKLNTLDPKLAEKLFKLAVLP